MSGFVEELKRSIQGDVYDSPAVKGMYSTDASVYQIMPLAVICPKHEEDVIQTLRIARSHKIPLLARGGGTSLAGQTVAEAIVLDFSKYMNSILLLDNKEVVVQPGVVRHQLNHFLKPKGLEFAPDPATSSRATIGGMIANNSSGTKSIIYGKTSDHVLELKMLLANGEIIHTKALSPRALQSKLQSQDTDSEYYRQLMNITVPLEQTIRVKYPKTMRRVGGYALDDFLTAGCGNLNPILIGSEGTLGIILEAKLKLVDLPKFKGVSVVQFDKAQDAIKATTTMVQYQPSAVEILSKMLLHYSRKNIETAPMCGFIKGDPESIQIIEFYGNNMDEIQKRAEQMHEELKLKGLGYAFDYYPEGKIYHDVWGIRERGLGLMLGEPTDKRGVPIIEDAAIPLEHLDAFIADVVEICNRRGIELDYYAHASVGVIHLKPMFDMREESDIVQFRELGYEVFHRVIHYGGSWSSEHGDGIVRSGFLKEFYGEEIYEAFRKTKELFDPDYLMNPGKIVDPPPIDSHLRYGTAYHDLPFPAVYQYRDQRDFFTAIHQCSGLGACRKISGGTMCPSFMVTRDEIDSTRGRANALRLAMSGQLENGLANEELPQVLDLCISCKACKAECPSSVDMARLKGEVMQYQFDHHGASLKDKIVGRSVELARMFSGTPAGLVNVLQSIPVFKQLMMKMMGLDTRRNLPTYSLKKWTSTHKKNKFNGHAPDVILLVDTYTQCHHPHIGQSAVELLEHLGKRVMLLDAGCCQRPRISHGFLREAKEKIQPGLNKLLPWLSKKIPIAVLEPGCASAWTDDIPDLISDDVRAGLLKQIKTFEQVLATILEEETDLAQKITPKSSQVRVHGHCHQKSIFGMEPVRSIFAHWPQVDFQEIDSGCCGMAGSFGYEAKHYEISKKMAERVLIPTIEDHPDAMIIANGFSCRHQIHDFGHREAVHIAEAFEMLKG